jgi:hypothetical protein
MVPRTSPSPFATALAAALALLAIPTLADAALITWLTFDDPTSPTTMGLDASGNGNHFNPVGTIATTVGLSGTAARLNGGKFARNFGTSQNASQLTVALWGRRDGSMNWMDWAELGDTGSTDRGLALENRSDNQFSIYNSGGFPGISFLSTTSPTWNIGEWHHLVVTFDQPSNTMSIYIDGILRASNTYTSAFNLNQVTFGGRWDSGDRNINGSLDEVQIYDHVLTPSEITFLFNNPGSIAPEPSRPLLLTIALAPLLLRRRRRSPSSDAPQRAPASRR